MDLPSDIGGAPSLNTVIPLGVNYAIFTYQSVYFKMLTVFVVIALFLFSSLEVFATKANFHSKIIMIVKMGVISLSRHLKDVLPNTLHNLSIPPTNNHLLTSSLIILNHVGLAAQFLLSATIY